MFPQSPIVLRRAQSGAAGQSGRCHCAISARLPIPGERAGRAGHRSVATGATRRHEYSDAASESRSGAASGCIDVGRPVPSSRRARRRTRDERGGVPRARGVLSAGSAVAASASTRCAGFPAAGNMPASLVFKLALAQAEAGDATGGRAPVPRSILSAEEGGTSVRTVYTQVRLTSARRAADAGDCDAAAECSTALSREQPGLAFTEGGFGHAARRQA